MAEAGLPDRLKRGAGAAEKLRGMTLLGTLVRTGSIAIILRPDVE